MSLKPKPKGENALDRTVFKFFEKFTNEDEELRVRSASELILFLTSGAAEKKEKERAYALKRLVRGVGSNNHASRAGFFTALLGYLEQVNGTEHCPTITEIFGLVKSELSDSDGDADNHKQIKLELRVGKVSVCGAIINSGLIETASDEELQTVLKALKKGMYKAATPLAIAFLCELVQKIDSKKFSSILWPIFEQVMNVPKDQHTMDTIHLLLVATSTHRKSVNKQFFENNFDSPQLLHRKNYPYLAGLLWDIKNTIAINHPFYDYLTEQLVKQDKVAEFWEHGVEPILRDNENDHKFKDIIALRVLITILNRLDTFQSLPQLLSYGLLETIVRKIKNFAQLSEDVRELYQEAFEALIECYPKITDEECKLQIFEKLVTSPSTILIEKYGSNKIIQNLLVTMDKESVKKVALVLKKLILTDDEAILNSERIHASQALQKIIYTRNVADEAEWRKESIVFFLNIGIFHTADGQKVLKSSKNEPALTSELAPTMKSLFFHCLEQKHSKLTDEKKFLLAIVEHVQETLERTKNKALRVPLSEEHLQFWNRMYKVIKSNDKQNKKLNSVFHILMMYMGLHLFSDPELAASSIAELDSVMKRVQGKKAFKASTSKLVIKQNGDAEPEWIEVVVDLFLNLMSQNSHLLRKVIGHMFPHLSSEMTLTAFNQILSVINLKDKTNPLSATEPDNDDNDEDNEEENDSKMDTDEDDDTSGFDSNGDDDEEQPSDESEDEEELEFSDEEENEKVSDKMRMAIHAALGGANPETDTESVDLDDMNEEDGRKLDEALAAAFKMFKQSKKTKPTKAEERVETTLTHFRMRVFDLIDIYLKNSPNMIICLELMLYIFEMLPVAIKETKHKQVLDRYRHIFNSLIKIKQFNVDVTDVSADQLPQILVDLVEKVAKGSSFPEKNQYLLKACQFIVICSQLVDKDSSGKKQSTIDDVFCKYLNEFIVDRNPPLTLNIFQTLIRMNWGGNWVIAKTLAENGLKKEVRIIRRTQTLQLLNELMKNRRFMNTDLQKATTTLKTIATNVSSYMEELQHSSNVSQNEFSELVQLVLGLRNFQQQNSSQELIPWKRVGTQIQKLRRFNLNSQTMNYYVRLCRQLQLKPIKNSQENARTPNGVGAATKKRKQINNGGAGEGEENDSDPDEEDAGETEQEEPSASGAVKRKKNGNTLKQKRLRKEERLKAASEGLESVSFVNVE